MTQNDPKKNTNNTWWQQLILHYAEAKLGTQLAAPTKNKDHNPCKNVKILVTLYKKTIQKFQYDYGK